MLVRRSIEEGNLLYEMGAKQDVMNMMDPEDDDDDWDDDDWDDDDDY